jgi:predicted CopG family antitoxin
MARKSTEDLIRVHIWVRKDDYEALQTMYTETVGISKIVRTLIQSHVKQVLARTTQKAPKMTLEEIKIDKS